jgi:threonine dehydratase
LTSDLEGLTSLDALRSAQRVIAGRLHRTPIASSATLSTRVGARVHLKLELFQKTGSFKPRGVLNALHHLDPEARARGVISLSAGNHAQALAWGASSIGVRSTIVMPTNAQRVKIDATLGYGGEVIQTSEDLLATALELQQSRGLTLVHPFDDLHVIAGQGTVGLEIMEDVPDADVVIIACGGGGLIAGAAAAVKAMAPGARVIGVEPEGAPGMTRSVERGEAIRLERLDTIADGLAAPFAGKHNLAHVQAFVDEMVLVSDQEIIAALGLLAERCKVVAEPAGAAAVAGLLSGRVTIPEGARVVAIVSGGNVSLERLKTLL